MLIVTTDGLAGYEIRNVLGEVLGVAVQTDQGAPAGQSQSSATFRVTGEQPGVGLAAARREAVDRLAQEAHRKGANAVVGMNFDTAQLSGGGHEVCAYGTAVWAEPAKTAAQAPPQQMPPQQAPATPPYPDPQQSPMAARNLTIGLHDRPR